MIWPIYIRLGNTCKSANKVAQNGTEIYGDANLWYRVIRDYVGPTVGSIMVDDAAAYEELQQLLGAGRFGKPVEVSFWNQKEDIF